jgi:hypothetical protein
MIVGDIGRRGFLIGAAATATLAGAPPVFAAAATTPFDLHFEIAHKFRPFDLIAPKFVQFDTGVATTMDHLVRTEIRPRAPYGSVLVEVRELDSTGVVLAGLADVDRSVLASYDAATGTVAIEVTIAGSTTIVKSAPAELRAPFQFAFVLNENAVTVLADPTGTGTGWQPLLAERDAVGWILDLRANAVLGRLGYAYGGRGGAALLGRVRAGYFGQAGVRDPHVVQHADGRPYIVDNKLYLTMTNAGLGYVEQAHWAVWTLDLADPTRLEQVALLFFTRNGLVLGDSAGQVVYDDDRGRFILLVSSWGDFETSGVYVRHVATEANLLDGVHVLPTERLELPSSLGTWDPALTSIDGRWHIAFVDSPKHGPEFLFRPALAVAPRGADYTEARSLVGIDTEVRECEGTILQRFGSTWYVLASDGIGRQYRVYDMGMRFLGTLDAPYGTNVPHPMIIPVEDGWWLLSFDGTQYAEPILGFGNHGDFIVMQA